MVQTFSALGSHSWRGSGVSENLISTKAARAGAFPVLVSRIQRMKFIDKKGALGEFIWELEWERRGFLCSRKGSQEIGYR